MLVRLHHQRRIHEPVLDISDPVLLSSLYVRYFDIIIANLSACAMADWRLAFHPQGDTAAEAACADAVRGAGRPGRRGPLRAAAAGAGAGAAGQLAPDVFIKIYLSCCRNQCCKTNVERADKLHASTSVAGTCVHPGCVRSQASHGIALAPRLNRELWPVIDAVLQRRLRRVGDEVRKSLAAEVDKLALQVSLLLLDAIVNSQNPGELRETDQTETKQDSSKQAGLALPASLRFFRESQGSSESRIQQTVTPCIVCLCHCAAGRAQGRRQVGLGQAHGVLPVRGRHAGRGQLLRQLPLAAGRPLRCRRAAQGG